MIFDALRKREWERRKTN